MKVWKMLKKKWNVESDQRMVWIFVLFSITGSCTVLVRKHLFDLLGINIAHPLLAFLVKLVAIYIVYQLLLFLFGTLMGEGRFVRWFLAKANGRFIGRKAANSYHKTD